MVVPNRYFSIRSYVIDSNCWTSNCEYVTLINCVYIFQQNLANAKLASYPPFTYTTAMQPIPNARIAFVVLHTPNRCLLMNRYSVIYRSNNSSSTNISRKLAQLLPTHTTLLLMELCLSIHPTLQPMVHPIRYDWGSKGKCLRMVLGL